MCVGDSSFLIGGWMAHTRSKQIALPKAMSTVRITGEDAMITGVLRWTECFGTIEAFNLKTFRDRSGD